MTADAVLVDRDDGTATITLNQPERRNALSADVQSGIEDALDEIGDEARCLVFEGAGSAFCAGGDIDAMRDRFERDPPPQERVRDLDRIHALYTRIAEYPAPTVAKVDGPAVGAGASLVLACDVQLASDRSVFGFVFRNVGLGVDTGVSYFLPRVVGTNVAKELVFTGEIVDADRALEIGLVNHVYPVDEFDERVDEFVDQLAAGPTVALGHSKRLIEDGFENSLEEAMTDEAVAGGVIYATHDHHEGVEAFLEDREPRFEGQ